MTQRIFDMDNEQDVRDLWNIMPDDVVRIKPAIGISNRIEFENEAFNTILFAINWHDKTETTRPMQEATEQDIGKLCAFYDEPGKTDDKPYIYYAVLRKIENQSRNTWFYTDRCDYFTHCRRLTKQEIEELC